MNLSMKWLSEFVTLDPMSPREFAEAMTMSGSKVEGWEIEGEKLDKVVVGQVLSMEKHPDADKLVVCQVDAGGEAPIQIVTGASNLTVGDKVPVALDGSTLVNGAKIKKGKLRGVESCGMMCSLGELGLTSHDFPYAIEDGIFVLQEECELGQDIRSVIGLNDTGVEFEITSNRPDCFSVIGLAREAAATFNKELKLHTPVATRLNGRKNSQNGQKSRKNACKSLCRRPSEPKNAGGKTPESPKIPLQLGCSVTQIRHFFKRTFFNLPLIFENNVKKATVWLHERGKNLSVTPAACHLPYRGEALAYRKASPLRQRLPY